MRLVENYEQTGNRKEFPSSESGRMQKGAVNVAKVGLAACKSRAALSARADSSVTGYHRYQGEVGADGCLPF